MASFEEVRQKFVTQWAGVNRYNPQTLSLLEDCLLAQLKENKYDLEVNLTILKLYQLNTNMFKPDIAAKVLLKCLMALPKSDIVLAKCLIDQNNVDVDPVKSVLELADLLEACNFGKVWALLKKQEMVDEIVGFSDSIRNFICHVVNITYQNIAFDTLKFMLGGLPDQEVKLLCKRENWEVKNDGYVYVYNHEATIKSRNIEEKLDFGNIQDILRSVA